ncbi:MAG: DUF2752 domain-containing protein [Lachnospiraceae bacterium]|nr:DUF2752 domain-containing protein [Lachnospiraceae bacterium]
MILQIVKKIKKDWDACWSGILILFGLWVVTRLLGKGLCIFQAKWGIPCPGCGMTRSMLLILQGQFAAAWKMHPFAYGWLVFGVIFFVDRYVVQGKEIVWKIALALLGAGMMIRYVFCVLPGVW